MVKCRVLFVFPFSLSPPSACIQFLVILLPLVSVLLLSSTFDPFFGECSRVVVLGQLFVKL